MKITCHSCAAKYTVSDEKVQGKTVKMKCRKCGATIVVGSASGGEDAHVTDDAAMGESPPAGSYLVNVADGDQRTMTLAEVIDAYNSGAVTADTYVWSDGMNDWQALGENEAIVAALNSAAGGANGHANGTNGGYGASAPYATPSAPEVAPAVAMSPDPSRSSPVAAKKERKSSDLFGGGYSDTGLSSSTSGASGTGKREENSVLFSLSALTATTGSAPAPAKSSSTTATKEDSGLIDLKALAASAPPPTASAPAAAPAVDAIGLFPLGAPVLAPPPVQMQAAMPTAAAPAGSSKLPLIIGGVVAVAAVVGVFLVVKGGGDTQPTAKPTTAVTAEAAPTVTTPPVATAVPTETASADAAAEASASASATAKPVAGNWKKGAGTAKAGGTAASTAAAGTATAAKTAAPKSSNCGCGTDLNCAMKCAAKGGK
jgi:predicted Zn finger-like uncharacterized protein